MDNKVHARVIGADLPGEFQQVAGSSKIKPDSIYLDIVYTNNGNREAILLSPFYTVSSEEINHSFHEYIGDPMDATSGSLIT